VQEDLFRFIQPARSHQSRDQKRYGEPRRLAVDAEPCCSLTEMTVHNLDTAAVKQLDGVREAPTPEDLVEAAEDSGHRDRPVRFVFKPVEFPAQSAC
jgi:hypothetical protein